MTYVCHFSESAGNKEGTHSTFWVLLSILLGAVAMLCKEQGITVLVSPRMRSRLPFLPLQRRLPGLLFLNPIAGPS